MPGMKQARSSYQEKERNRLLLLGESTKSLLGRSSRLATLHNTQMYAMLRLLILLCPLSMLLDKSIKASFEFPEPLTQELRPGRVEPPEDVGKGGDLWHGRAGADDNLARAELQLESTVRDSGNKVH
jgi:hypothetical protein